MTLEAIRFDAKDVKLLVLDQRILPFTEKYISVESAQDGHDAIKDMVVRGAPAIAIVGALSVAVDLWNTADLDSKSSSQLVQLANEHLDLVVSARPTAVNVGNMARDLKAQLVAINERPQAQTAGGRYIAQEFVKLAAAMMSEDVESNTQIGEYGANWLSKTITGQHFSVATICNTGSLATAGYGTALGIIRSLHSHKTLEHAYCLETRPYNQGARLTAFELVHDRTPATLITDSMAAALFKTNPNVRAVIVGADRVANNGDTANKIGTYQLAVLAKYHGLKFIVAAPTTSIDTTMKSGAEITIEERPAQELVQVKGAPLDSNGNVAVSDETATTTTINVQVAAPGINVWNPSFDVTPSELIDAIVTEKGVAERTSGGYNLAQFVAESR